jgi:hypothetical protein
LTGKLKALKDGFKQQVDSVRTAISAYDGLITKSDVTTNQVIEDIHNQVSNFKTYSKDVKRLIKAGVDPSAIRELSEKGPQFVHALATGTNKQLQIYKGHWAARQREIRGSFAESMQLQFENLRKQIRRMQRQIDSLRGKSISITAKPAFQFSKSFTRVDWLSARQAAGRMAGGGRITQGTGPTADDVPIWASKGETVVPTKDSRRPEFRAWAAERGIPGFARGGSVGEQIAQTGVAHTGAANLMGNFTKRVLDKALSKLLTGSSAIRAFIRSVDPLPYIWGAAGPRGYDCSGLVSAVYGKHTRRGGGHGQRYFTTATIGTGTPGLKPGLGGIFQIGVTPGRGHMAGRYGGLGFEAESSRTGIKIGSAASRPESFARHFHMARGGAVDDKMLAALSRLRGVDIGGDAGKLRINGKVFDRGGYLMPGATLAVNRTGRPEPVGAGRLTREDARMIAQELAKVIPTTVAVDDIVGGLRRKQGRYGGMALGIR